MAKRKLEQDEATSQTVNGVGTPASSTEARQGREPGDEPDEKVYPPIPNPFLAAHDNRAHVKLFAHRDPYEDAIVFAEKPDQDVIDCLKENGFIWNNREKAWTRAIGLQTRHQDRLTATRTFHKVVGMILEEKGLTPAVPEQQPF